LTVTLAGILASDALCPDHRAWVQTLASVAIVGAVVAIVQVVRGQASAALFALGASLVGIAIGVIDAVHDPGRGTLIAIGFAAAAAGSAAIALRMGSVTRWSDDLATAHVALAQAETEDGAEASAPIAAAKPDPAATPAR